MSATVYKGMTDTGVQYKAHQSPHLVTFCDSQMGRSAMLCVESSKAHCVGTHARFTPTSISQWPEIKVHPKIFRQPDDPRRVWGWWAWKSLIIAKELSWLPDGSILIYSDAGVEFINNVNYIIDRMDQDIFLFGNMYDHAHWCKRDVVDVICRPPAISIENGYKWPTLAVDDDGVMWRSFGKQVQASVIFFRVSDWSRAFVKEWLDWCLFEGGRLVDDSPSRTPNHPEFQENRHDQAILTTMAYRDGIKLHAWPAVYNRDLPNGGFVYPREGYPEESYPTLFWHHRRRNHEWENVA